MLYFAYGSNMDWKQMKDRCPSTRFVGVAVLLDHSLAFTRKSERRGCGVADAVPTKDGKLWGVVYEISDMDVGKLDSNEGYRPGRAANSYLRRECMVFLDDNKNQPLTIWTYFAEREENPPLPSQKYKNQIVNGARRWGLPEEYIVNVLDKIMVG